MAKRVAVINVVGLNGSLLASAPRLREHAAKNRLVRLNPILPAVTCSVQASMLTGVTPRDHGIVGNGWYHRDLAEVRFWQRSAHLIQSEPVWETARRRDASVTCANLFWWHNTYSSADVTLNVRPIYKADGLKLPDCWANPERLRHELQDELGPFPLFRFWGPAANIESSRWIAAAAQRVMAAEQPTLTLIYLPHLDYALQKFGPGTPEAAQSVREIDAVVGGLLDCCAEHDIQPIILSEYGIERVSSATPVNRALREAGLVSVRLEDGLEVVDPGASSAFAVADHQVAHVYVQNPRRLNDAAEICRRTDGVEQVLDRTAQNALGLDHPRSGDLVLVAERGRWFTYDWWFDDTLAPDFARTVDIHRKPGYDPRELFTDKSKAGIAWRLAKRKLGMRTLLDVVPLDTSLVKGSHGRVDQPPDEQPLLLLRSSLRDTLADENVPCTAVRNVILAAMGLAEA